MANTKGPAGRFGARYGIKVRRKVDNIERKQKSKHLCPYCGVLKVKRISLGIFQCKKCEIKFTGGAYTPK